MEEPAEAGTILRARIALLATAIGGPDYTSTIDPPPYKLGDDCLACLKDLKRWFRLVDDQQRRWDVAMAAAEYRILIEDLLPILIDWEDKRSLSRKLVPQGTSDSTDTLKNRVYYDKIALQCLQLLVIMTWPLALTESSSTSQVNSYVELRKHQLVYKKAILSTNGGKTLKAVCRLAIDVLKIDKLDRTPRDYMIIRLVLNFLRNVIAIEPGELLISTKQKIPQGINAIDSLPPDVSMDDISLNTVVDVFHRNKVFSLLLTLGSSLTTEVDQNFVNVPLSEIMFFLTRNINPEYLFSQSGNHDTGNPIEGANKNGIYSTRPNLELSELLNKEARLRKILVNNTSPRHSRFGAMMSIETPGHGRLTVSGGKSLLNPTTALYNLDRRKQWRKPRGSSARDDAQREGLPSSMLNSQLGRSLPLQERNTRRFIKFINNFLDSSFNTVLHSVTNYFTTEQDRLGTLEQVVYLLFIAWFTKYQLLRSRQDPESETILVAEVLNETTFILVCQILKNAYIQRNWSVVHTGMIAFNEILNLLNNKGILEDDRIDVDFIIERLFSEDRIRLLTTLTRSAAKHSQQYMKSCIFLTHNVLKTLESKATSSGELVVLSAGGKRNLKPGKDITENKISQLMKEEGVDRDVALEILTSELRERKVSFERVQNSYINDNTIDMYIKFLQGYQELDYDSLKKVFSFFHRICIKARQDALLFRIDLIVLLQEILSESGLPRNSPSRKCVEEFSNFYLRRLRDRLKRSPAWFVSLLFPPLHDRDVGYFQRYMRQRVENERKVYCVMPSTFKSIEDEEMLPSGVVKDMKFGILISTLIDDGKTELLDQLVQHMTHTLAIFNSWHSVNVDQNNELQKPPNEPFHLTNELSGHLFTDSDFRALLEMLKYVIPQAKGEVCYLPGTKDVNELKTELDTVKKHMNEPFQTPNGLASSTYLVRPDSMDAQNQDDLDGKELNNNNETGDADYFKELENERVTQTSNRNESHTDNVGHKVMGNFSLRASKNTKEDEPHRREKRHHEIVSKEYISDSDEELDPVKDPIFFENELYLRWLLDKANGSLSTEKYKLFYQFASERRANGGRTVSDFSGLFDGPVPSIDVVRSSLNEHSTSNRSVAKIRASLLEDNEGNRVRRNNKNSALMDSSVTGENLFREDSLNSLTAVPFAKSAVEPAPGEKRGRTDERLEMISKSPPNDENVNDNTDAVRIKRTKILLDDEDEDDD